MNGRKALRNLIQKFCPEVEVVAETMTVEEAIDPIETLNPDLVFLDIELPKQNGFTLLELFPNPGFEVIFTTAYEQYAVKAFQMAAVDYLLKPIDFVLLRQAIQRARVNKQRNGLSKRFEIVKESYQNGNFDRLALPTSNGYIFINIKDIVACEASRNYTYFNLKSGKKIIVSKPLKHFEKLLGQRHFFRIHRSIIVNMNCIDRYIRTKNGEIVLDNGMVFPISESRRENFLRKIELMGR